jgi:hypothetical protein
VGISASKYAFVFAKAPLIAKDRAQCVVALLQVVPWMRCNKLPNPSDLRFATVLALEMDPLVREHADRDLTLLGPNGRAKCKIRGNVL